MKYLACIELLTAMLRILRRGQRDQVPMARMPELMRLILSVIERIDNDNIVAKVKLNDVYSALFLASQNKGVEYLPSAMKETITSGINDALCAVSDTAWDYYTTRDVPIDQDALLRIVVQYHYLRGEN